ncbi:MAG TPA: penicillin acylase family protein, partial [Cytophagales bacterium]|nr:penicillin acylase family protein [Cytophagales bacterium]
MKKRLLAVTGVVVTLAWCLALNTKFGSIPPLGKFLNPFRGFWQNAESAVSGEETLALQDLKAPVTVLYDSLMVPHIFAQHEEDLFRAQGYVTARHRLWQMEFQ